MPEVHDPTGGSMFRSRRRKKKKVLHPKAVAVGRGESNAASASQKFTSNRSPSSNKKVSINDPLEFGGSLDFENTVDHGMASPTATSSKRKVRLLSNDAMTKKIPPNETRTMKQGKDDSLRKPSCAAPSLSLVSATGRKKRTAVSETLVARGRLKRDDTTTTGHCVPYAIAFDTRCLNTQAGKDDQQDFLRGVKDFLRTKFRRRGFSTSVVAWTEYYSSHSTSPVKNGPNPEANHETIITIRSKSIEGDKIDEILLNINGSPIGSAMSNEDADNRMATLLPKELMAKSTWNALGDLVEAIVDSINPSDSPQTFGAKPKVVVFTSATSFLLDTDSKSHTHGINAFWNKAQPYFLESKVQSIEIVAVIGETVIDRTTKDRCGTTLGNNPLSNDSDIEEGDFKDVDESNAFEHERKNDRKRKPSSLNDSVGEQTNILKTIQRYIETKVEVDLKMNRSRLDFDSKLAGKHSPMKVSLSVVDMAVDFPSLCQKWSRESMHAVTASIYSHTHSMVSFQLPETIAFDACDVSFATYYKNMPFRVDSLTAKQLYADLLMLSKAELQVLQLIPIPSIDASLIYGVTIGLRVVHEGNEESHHETNYLVQSLFKHLAARDCALLLQSKNDQDIEMTGFRDGITQCDVHDGLFHSMEDSQYFLFMPEFFVSKDGPVGPKSGVLRRVASVDHILEEIRVSDVLNSVHPPHVGLGNEKSRLGNNPFFEYIEDSLGSLNCSPLNPWIQDRLNNSKPRPYVIEEQDQASSKSDALPSCNSKDQIITNEDGQAAMTKISTENEEENLLDDKTVDSDSLSTDESGIISIAEGATVSSSKETDENSKTFDTSEVDRNSKTPDKCETNNSKDAVGRNRHNKKRGESMVSTSLVRQICNVKARTNGKKLNMSHASSPGTNTSPEKKSNKKNAADFSSSSSSSSESSFGTFHY